MKNLCKRTCFIFSLFFIFSLTSSALALDPPDRDTPGAGKEDIAPYDVILYAMPNYSHKIGHYRIQPGKRMLKIPKFKSYPKSIAVGSKAGVLLFSGLDYKSHPSFRTKEGIGQNETPFKRISHSIATYLTKHIYDWKACSLIIHRKDIPDILGVALYNRFYPLPDDPQNKISTYHKINTMPKQPKIMNIKDVIYLRIIPGGTGSLSWPHGHPSVKDMKVTVSGHYGSVTHLPKGGEHKYPVTGLNVGPQIASIRIEYTGPFDKKAYMPYQPPKAHKAPPAPDKEPGMVILESMQEVKPGPGVAQPHDTGTVHQPEPGAAGPAEPHPHQPDAHFIPEIGGRWKSSINRIYHIHQHGDHFEWEVEGVDERGEGRINGKNIEVNWHGAQGGGSAHGRIVAFDGERLAIRIKWNNGIVFFRE